MSKQIGYIRVSSAEQNTARQLDGVEVDKTFTDKASGAKTDNRKQLTACLDYLRDGDVLHIHSIDRLARNLADLQSIVTELTARQVTVVFHKEGLTFSANTEDAMQTLMLQMLGAFAQFERAMIKSRQLEGIAAAKAAGKRLGRAPKLSVENKLLARQRRADGESVAALAVEYGVSRQTMNLICSETYHADSNDIQTTVPNGANTNN
jgi:DNA invertase Pin-like site-specific DNA recombinase